jgi:hypothetical protein
MATRSSVRRNGSRTGRLIWTISFIVGIWTGSDLIYYFLLPGLGQKTSYNEDPIANSLYYVFWAGVAVIVFWPQYASWPRYTRWATFENRLASLGVWLLAFAGTVVFVAYVLPALPPFNPRAGTSPPELPLATPWYFLPKSIEILFQQLLVVALVLSLAAEKYSLRQISISCALLFGGSHFLLVLGGASWGYAIRFATLAALFGLAFPYLILRIPNGLAYSYVTHWAYYAATILMARTVGPGLFLDLAKKLFGGS